MFPNLDRARFAGKQPLLRKACPEHYVWYTVYCLLQSQSIAATPSTPAAAAPATIMIPVGWLAAPPVEALVLVLFGLGGPLAFADVCTVFPLFDPVPLGFAAPLATVPVGLAPPEILRLVVAVVVGVARSVSVTVPLFNKFWTSLEASLAAFINLDPIGDAALEI